MSRCRPLVLAAALLLVTASAGSAAPGLAWKNPSPQGNALWGVAFESSTIGYAVGERGTVLRTADGGVSWTDLSDRDVLDETIREVEVVAPGTLVAITAAGRILRSTDGALTWAEIAHPATEALHEMAQVGGTLTVLGQFEEMIRSTDGGLTWSVLPSPTEGFGLKGQYWFDDDRGIVVGNALAQETFDGGATWTDLPGGEVSGASCEAIDFAGDQGVIVGEFSTWRTRDGGATWENESDFDDPIYQRRVFIDDADTYVVFVDTEGAAIARTTTDGDVWDYPVLRRDVAGFLDAVRHPDGGFVTVSSYGDVFRSPDGIAWTNATAAPDDGARVILDALGDRPDGTVYASGYGQGTATKRWLRSDDLGETWAVDTDEPPSDWIMAIHFVDDDRGYAAGYETGGSLRVDRTLDGGATWTAHDLVSSSGFVTDVVTVGDDDQTVIASLVLENDGRVEVSQDGGVTWSVTTATAERMECVAAAGGDVAYAGGGGGFPDQARLWRTDDAGVTWTLLPGVGLPDQSIWAMAWQGPDVGLVAPDGSGVYRTVDGGQTFSPVTTGWVREMDADGAVVVVGSFREEDFQVSTDFGVSWTHLRFPFSQGPGAVLARGTRVLAAAPGSSILAGEVPDAVAVSGVDVPGGDGLGVRARAAGEGARVRLHLDRAADVRLDVVDVQGRRVRTIPAGRREAGVHDLRWDGRSVDGTPVAAGVVWIRATLSDGRHASDRVVLLR